MSLSLRLAIMLSPLLVWGVLYLTSWLGGISPKRFAPWLRAGYVVLMGVSVMLFVFDRTHVSDVVVIHAFGLLGAELWITRQSKRETEQLVTSLKL